MQDFDRSILLYSSTHITVIITTHWICLVYEILRQSSGSIIKTNHDTISLHSHRYENIQNSRLFERQEVILILLLDPYKLTNLGVE